MNIIADKINSKHFMFISDSNEFVAEASELPKGFNPMSPVWDDSADVGFVMVSAKTGREAVFVLDSTDRSIEGDIYGWYFVADPMFNKTIGLKDKVTVLIIND